MSCLRRCGGESISFGTRFLGVSPLVMQGVLKIRILECGFRKQFQLLSDPTPCDRKGAEGAEVLLVFGVLLAGGVV